MTAMLGALRELPGNCNYIGDLIPVDICSNQILAATAFYSKQSFNVVHCGSSARNPVTWKQTKIHFFEYFRRNKIKSEIADPSFKIINSYPLYRMTFALKRTLPQKGFSALASVVGNGKMKKDAQRWAKLNTKMFAVTDLFRHFTSNEWIFDLRNTNDILNWLDPEEKKIFNCDISTVDWKMYMPFYAYGLTKFILKEYVEHPLS